MNPVRLRRYVVLLGLTLFALGLGVLLRTYGTIRVPRGMDTIPLELPAGSLCIIHKRPGTVVPGAVVFVSLDDGATVLSRVGDVLDDGRFTIRHDNPRSRFAYLERRGPYRVEDVRGVVIGSFKAAEGQLPASPKERPRAK